MDDQTAEAMFNVVAKEVAEYIMHPSLEERLIEQLQKKLTFLSGVSLNLYPNQKSIEADICFFIDGSKKEKAQVYVHCEKTKQGIAAKGTVNLGQVLYTCNPRIYD